MTSPTPAEIRKAQDTQIRQLLQCLSEAHFTAINKNIEREEARATAVSKKDEAISKYKELPPATLAKFEGYVAAFDEAIRLGRSHELIMDEMEDRAEVEWNNVRDGSLEKRKQIIEKWTAEYEKVKITYEAEVMRVYTYAGLESHGTQ